MASAKSSRFVSEVSEVTPSLAEEFLTRNTTNRSLRLDYVQQLAGAMERGEWTVNGEPIQIAKDGTLLNGQHRLSAVVRSGKTVSMLIVKGLPPSSLRTMDMGTRRNLSDVLALHGHSDTTNLAAVLGLLYRHRTGAKISFQGRTAPTVPQALELLEKEPGTKGSVIAARRIYKETGLRMSVAAFLLYIFEEADSSAGAAFFDALCEPHREDDGSAVIALRSHLDRVRSDENYQLSTLVLTAITIRAFNAWREGREVEALSYRSGNPNPEAFPVVLSRAEVEKAFG